MSDWRIEQQVEFERAFKKLPEYEQAVMIAAVEKVLTPLGKDVCATEWGKNFGEGCWLPGNAGIALDVMSLKT